MSGCSACCKRRKIDEENARNVAIAAPVLPVTHERMPLSVPFPSVPGVRDSFDRALPPSTIEALLGLGKQLESDVLEPLIQAETTDDLSSLFQRLHPRFTLYYLAIGLGMLAALEGVDWRLRPLTAQAFREAEDVLLTRGPGRIGRDATLAAVLGVRTVARIARAIGDQDPPESLTGEWTANFVAYMLASFALVFGLTRAEPSGHVARNLAILANWSKHYAVRLHTLSRKIGLLRAVTAPGSTKEGSDADDLLLANTGLEDYPALLISK
jgi:hypothetical protein